MPHIDFRSVEHKTPSPAPASGRGLAELRAALTTRKAGPEEPRLIRACHLAEDRQARDFGIACVFAEHRGTSPSDWSR